MMPQRMCAVCRELSEKNQLLRIVKQENSVILDLDGKVQGRGAYVCKKSGCLAKARKVRAFERSFSMRIDGTIYDALEAWCDNGEC